ncbi:hypothetical protein GLW07_06335 [Bacillus hwajinpoensis]|uniref:Uncharacterized protein n=1 Tax=Guptibacillus hwajinpoensis TaxID=208199 RepID=A0A845EWS3_9BACL|nr:MULTISPECIES: hypothetical protein [Bacillaceae]MYL62974.1 hypothetical protein [Pseudalkalibacillus hwajinpoensis]PFG14024.1 hypothetical protein ATG70_2248 [Bacillus sp. es.036]
MLPFHLMIITKMKSVFDRSLSSELHQRSIHERMSEAESKRDRASMWLS